jgi:hypothetical protein
MLPDRLKDLAAKHEEVLQRCAVRGVVYPLARCGRRLCKLAQ